MTPEVQSDLRSSVRPEPEPVPEAEPDEFHDVVAVLMAGGIGTRFWPLSTPQCPKQFLTELAGRSLYMRAFDRARLLVPADRILVMTGAAFVDLVRQQTPDATPRNVIPEPLRRDTAAAVILASLIVADRWPNAVMAVFPSDHFIGGAAEFRRTLVAAVTRARQGGLGTIGIRPTYAATGYGYLRLAASAEPLAAQRVEEFVEKPDRRKAEQYLASGQFLWNSGIFVWQARELLQAAERHLPDTHSALAGLTGAAGEGAFSERAMEAFRRIKPISIDFGVMEKARDVWCVPAAFEWSDIGGWLATDQLLPPDECGNQVCGSAFLDEVAGTLVIGRPGHPIAVAGLTDCIIVHSDAGTLVCHKSAADRIKPLISRILGL